MTPEEFTREYNADFSNTAPPAVDGRRAWKPTVKFCDETASASFVAYVEYANGKYIGRIIQDMDGDWRFWPTLEGGCWSAHVLHEIADELDRRNPTTVTPAAEQEGGGDYRAAIEKVAAMIDEYAAAAQRIQENVPIEMAEFDRVACESKVVDLCKEHGVEDDSPAGALLVASTLLDDHAKRLEPTLHRREYRMGVMNGLKDAQQIIQHVLRPALEISKPPAVPQPAAEEERPILLEGTLVVGVYRGFKGVSHWDAEAKCYNGRVSIDKDVVTFIGCTDAEVVQAFKESVDDYLAMLNPSAG